MRRAATPTGSRATTPRLSAHTPRGGTPSTGTPRPGTPTQRTPRQGTPRQGTPRQDTPRGTPRQGTPRQSNTPTPRTGTPTRRSSNNNPAPSANATSRFSPQRTYTTPTRTYTTPRRHIPDASPQLRSPYGTTTANASSIRRTPLRVASDTGRLGRRPSPLMYRGNPPEHKLHSGLISNKGLAMQGGKARSMTPSNDVIAPRPLSAGEKPDPLMFISKMGSPIVCRGMGAAKPPETKEWHPGRKAFAPGPPDSLSIFYSTPKQTPSRRICIAPSTHDIPGLNDGGRSEPKPKPQKRSLPDGPPVFEPPPFEKFYTPSRRQNYVKVEHDVLLQRPATSITPFRSGARSASPVLSRYNNIS